MRGLNYLHRKGVVHRDIKPQNLLIDPSCHVLKICDFGSAKKLDSKELNVAYITTRNYRAPELIVGKRDYDFSIDIWSAGCVIAECMLGKPLFESTNSQHDHLVEIIKKLGTPDRELLYEWNQKYAHDLPNATPR